MVEIVTPERKQKLKEAEEKSKSLARQSNAQRQEPGVFWHGSKKR